MTSLAIRSDAVRPSLQSPDESRSELVIDVRSLAEFRRSHIPGSHHIAAGLLLSGEFPDHDLLLVAESDERAVELADALHEAGFHRRIRHLQGGFQAWVIAGLPLEQALSAESGQQVGKDLIPVVLLVGVATLALSLQHASVLLFSVTLALLLAPLAVGHRSQRLLQPLRRRLISGA